MVDLQRFVFLRSELLRERDQIVERLGVLNSALGEVPSVRQSASAPKQRISKPTPPPKSSEVPSLREAIAIATARGPVRLADLVPAVRRLGYQFTSKNPVNSLGAYLYSPRGKEHFRKLDSGFVPR